MLLTMMHQALAVFSLQLSLSFTVALVTMTLMLSQVVLEYYALND